MERKKNDISQQTADDYDYLSNAASSQDATGLIPANPYLSTTDSYDELYHYKPPKGKRISD